MTTDTRPKPTAPAAPAAKPKKEKPNESKSTRFSRIASARLNKALKMIALLENLNGSTYEYNDQQRAAIVSHLSNAVNRVDAALAAKRGKADDAETIRI